MSLTTLRIRRSAGERGGGVGRLRSVSDGGADAGLVSAVLTVCGVLVSEADDEAAAGLTAALSAFFGRLLKVLLSTFSAGEVLLSTLGTEELLLSSFAAVASFVLSEAFRGLVVSAFGGCVAGSALAFGGFPASFVFAIP